MKLIKLVSDENVLTSQFTDNFSIPITLQENAQISLKSMSIEFDSPQYVIDNTNNLFTYTTLTRTQGGEHAVQLQEGSYLLKELVREIQRKMNNVLDINSDETNNKRRDYGLQWTVIPQLSTNNDIQLRLHFVRTASIAMNNSNTAPAANVSMTYNSGTFYKSVADSGTDYNAYVELVPFISKGGFEINVILKEQASNINTANWIIGCDNSGDSIGYSTKSTITDKLIFGMSNSNGKYATLLNGAWVESVVSIEAEDVLRIHKRNGKIIYNITKGTSPAVLIEGDEVNANSKTKNLGVDNSNFVIFAGQNGAKIGFNNIDITTDPNVKVNNDIYSIEEPQSSFTYFDLGAGVSKSLIILKFPTVDVRRLMGFARVEYSIDGISGDFTSDKSLSLNFFGGDDLLIEIPELSSVNTYCHDFKQTRNIIMSIPVSELREAITIQEGGNYILSYSESANFVFIDLQNKQPLRIPSMTFRVISSKGKLIPCSGRMSALLLHQ